MYRIILIVVILVIMTVGYTISEHNLHPHLLGQFHYRLTTPASVTRLIRREHSPPRTATTYCVGRVLYSVYLDAHPLIRSGDTTGLVCKT